MRYHCIEASWRRDSRHMLQLRLPCQGLTRLKYPFLSYSVLLMIRYVTLWPLTFTFYLWPWALVVYRLWRGQTLYQIWEKSNNPRRSYCDFNIWPNDLEQLSRVAQRNFAAIMNFVNLSVLGLQRLSCCLYVIAVTYDVCLEVRGEIIRTVLCCIVYWRCAQS